MAAWLKLLDQLPDFLFFVIIGLIALHALAFATWFFLFLKEGWRDRRTGFIAATLTDPEAKPTGDRGSGSRFKSPSHRTIDKSGSGVPSLGVPSKQPDYKIH
eukprot:GHVQ01026520.1.p3 GENE.GHVQ01026520.1~~GHVQ01026520.1.p3  ORF type:complete len:102 (-),score=8.05 GHVQ01026520.1:2392-2697(-)